MWNPEMKCDRRTEKMGKHLFGLFLHNTQKHHGGYEKNIVFDTKR
jgi:hypothetical protein